METIYLDHNQLIYLIEGENTDLKEKVNKLLESKSHVIVSSFWNILELSKSKPEQARLLACYLDKIQSWWFIPSPPINHLEVENFIFSSYYRKPQKIVYPFCKSISEAFTYLTKMPVENEDSALSLANDFISNPLEILEIEKTQTYQAECLREISQARKKDKAILAKCKEKALQEQIKLYLPEYDPVGNLIREDIKDRLFEYCLNNKKQLYKACPIFRTEELLFDFRTSSPKRKPENQDAIDLQHQVLALTYCDHFVTNDGYVLNGNEYVKKHFANGRLAMSHKSILTLNQAQMNY